MSLPGSSWRVLNVVKVTSRAPHGGSKCDKSHSGLLLAGPERRHIPTRYPARHAQYPICTFQVPSRCTLSCCTSWCSRWWCMCTPHGWVFSHFWRSPCPTFGSFLRSWEEEEKRPPGTSGRPRGGLKTTLSRNSRKEEKRPKTTSQMNPRL